MKKDATQDEQRGCLCPYVKHPCPYQMHVNCDYEYECDCCPTCQLYCGDNI